MAFSEPLAARVRSALSGRDDIVEKKMFGGMAFMAHGHMCCGVTTDTLMLRVGPDAYEEILGREHARPMDFTGRPLRGMIYVDEEGFESDADLEEWIALGLAFVDTLPAK